ncbi:MAG TPA: glycosyltransferase [Acidimicrobiales bacterium]|jgi:trehalose synthase|nr:glycosyltransferase [Acidimicrobiales bacterium]
MNEAELPSLDPSRFETMLDFERWRRFDRSLRRGAALMEGRTLVHVNSTMNGGGVAELLSSVLGYLLGARICSRWLVVEGTEEFFVLTKRIHYLLHGKEGDGGDLGPAEAELYQSVLAAEFVPLAEQIKPGDVVILHDPQVVGLAPQLRDLGAYVIWNCHVGADVPNEHSRRAWDFLLPAASRAHAQVFSRAQYEWDGLEAGRVVAIPPCIDAFSPKNQAMGRDQVDGILAATGLSGQPRTGAATFTRVDGSRGQVFRTTKVIEECPLPPGAPVVTQISRWDPLKDHAGVARSFAEGVPLELGAHLVLAGPSPEAVADDPEGATTLDELWDCIASLPASIRSRVHVACLPMQDTEENAAVVNALQRRSDVVVQKSLAEGFGLTVAEAMWKARPTVASAVGGMQDQISNGVSGVLVDDPEDGCAFGVAISDLVRDRSRADALGEAARASVVDNFLAPRYLSRYLELIASVMAA